MKIDKVAQEHIEALETDNDHLRVENEELQKENVALRAELERMVKDRQYVAA